MLLGMNPIQAGAKDQFHFKCTARICGTCRRDATREDATRTEMLEVKARASELAALRRKKRAKQIDARMPRPYACNTTTPVLPTQRNMRSTTQSVDTRDDATSCAPPSQRQSTRLQGRQNVLSYENVRLNAYATGIKLQGVCIAQFNLLPVTVQRDCIDLIGHRCLAAPCTATVYQSKPEP